MRTPFKFLAGIADAFTWQFALTLVAVYGILKGIVNEVVKTAALPYFKSLGVSGNVYQSLYTIAELPWSLKAAMGILADTVPIYGYHKLPYILITSLLGVASYVLLTVVQFSASTAALAAGFAFLAFFQVAFIDLLAEGKYAELMRSRPDSGGDIVSYVYALYFTGSLIGALVSGPMADRFNPRYIFLVCVPLSALVLFPVLLGWFPDRRLPENLRGIRTDKLRQHAPLVKLAIALTASALVTGVSALRLSGTGQALLFLANAAVLLPLAYAWLPRVMRKANLYFFTANMLYVSVKGATDYWYTADASCVPDGPQFSYTFFNSYATLLSCVVGATAVALFQRFASKGRFRVVFAALCLLKILGSVPDIAQISRVNVRLGLSDEAAFLLGDAVIQKLTYTMEYLPAIVLTAKICPAGMESTVFAILASFMNLGGAGARALGVGLVEVLGIRTVSPCNFDNLALAVFIAHVALPMLLFPLIVLLIPDVRMTDEIVDGYETSEERQPLVTEQSGTLPDAELH